MDKTPIYPYPAAYAQENGELEQYRASMKALDACKRAIEKAIRAHVGKILEKVQLFDVYRGAQVPQGKKSVAYALILRAADRTLTVEECDKAMAAALEGLAAIGAEIRK